MSLTAAVLTLAETIEQDRRQHANALHPGGAAEHTAQRYDEWLDRLGKAGAGNDQ